MNPADNPKEHERMSSDGTENQATEQSQSETEAMSTEPDDLGGMHVRLKDENLYQVGNPSEGTAYLVNMHNAEHDGTMTCTCPDYRFRAQEGEHRACKHIQAVIRVSPSELTTDQLAFKQLVREYEILSDKVESVSQQLSSITSDVHEHAGTESRANYAGQQESVPASDAAGSGEQMAGESAQEAADKLQAAYDNVVNGMDVQASGGQVWVNKTPDAPDTLPGPGNVDVFEAFLSGPSQVQYVHDDHTLAGKRPGQWFKNVIDPSDVDQYISEVLE